MSKIRDLTGKRFGRLFVISISHTKKCAYWHCRCDCGITKIIPSSSLVTGRTRSCGCLKLDANTTHGLTGSAEWVVWQAMNARCNCTKAGNFHLYGGRGIEVCERWKSFDNFLSDMGNRPEGMTLDRIDVNGNYCPENCRWATQSQQNRNKRNTKRFLFDGEMLCLIEIAERTGINYDRFCSRIFKDGWSIEKAALTPLGPPSRKGEKRNPYRTRVSG